MSNENNAIRVFRGADHDQMHDGMFVSTDRDYAESYGDVAEYELDVSILVDTLDLDFMEKHLPLFDSYDEAEIDTIEAYEERLSDTWEMVEAARFNGPVIRITEGGIINYLVNDASRLTRVDPAPTPSI